MALFLCSVCVCSGDSLWLCLCVFEGLCVCVCVPEWLHFFEDLCVHLLTEI